MGNWVWTKSKADLQLAKAIRHIFKNICQNPIDIKKYAIRDGPVAERLLELPIPVAQQIHEFSTALIGLDYEELKPSFQPELLEVSSYYAQLGVDEPARKRKLMELHKGRSAWDAEIRAIMKDSLQKVRHFQFTSMGRDLTTGEEVFHWKNDRKRNKPMDEFL